MTPKEALVRDNLNDLFPLIENALKVIKDTREIVGDKLSEIDELDENIMMDFENSVRNLENIKSKLEEKRNTFLKQNMK